MSDSPTFDEVAGGPGLDGVERERLERVHRLLVDAGPPPELTPSLERAPQTEASVAFLPRRRRGALILVAAALALAAFGAGYLVGHGADSRPEPFAAERTVVLGEGPRVAVVRVGAPDANGNRPMLISTKGLTRLAGEDYYTLFMTKNGKPVATCGTFNVAGPAPAVIRLNVAYDPDDYDGLLLAHYRGSDHKDIPLLRAAL